MERIGVIGLGRMGSAIARRMTEEGRPVLGWTRSGRKVNGVQAAADLDTLVRGSDTLILSLYDDQAVAEVLDALMTHDLTGKQIIDTSTVRPSVLSDRAERIAACGGQAVDAPISGGPDLVAAGKCGVFIGGEDASATRATATLAAISGRIFHVGPLGTGLVMKVINNAMLQVYFNGLSELLPLAKRAGLPLDTALRILCGGPAGVPMVTDRLPKILGEDQTVGVTLETLFKDNEVFQAVVGSFGLSAPSLAAFGARVAEAGDAGLLQLDPAAMIRRAYDNG